MHPSRQERIGPPTGWPAERTDPGTDAAFDDMVHSLRRLQAAMAASRPPAEVSAEITQRLNHTADALETFAVAESDRPFGNLHDVPGRGQAMSPTFTYDYLGSEKLTGTVVFSDFYLGASAVHGGAIPLIFDEVLGRLANEQRPASRTAYLHVDYRRITPTDKVLRIDARVDRVDGRKLYLSGILRDGSTLLVEAEALFVILRSDQP